jgi:hypothetical protein
MGSTGSESGTSTGSSGSVTSSGSSSNGSTSGSSTTGGLTSGTSTGSSTGGSSTGKPDAGCAPGKVKFAAQAVYAVGVNPTSVAAIGDGGFDDLVVTNQFDSTVSVLVNLGDGGFAPQTTYAVGENPTAVTVGDVTGDGIWDLAVTNYGPLSADTTGTVSVLLGQSAGGFLPQMSYPAGFGPCSIVLGNFYGTGLMDIVETNIEGGSVSLFPNEVGNPGMYGLRTDYVNDLFSGYPIAVATADFNGDGRPDLAYVDNTNDFLDVMLSDGGGNFAPQVTYAVGSGPTSVAVGDFNGDGWPDLAVANTGPPGTVSVLFNLGDGGFAPQVTYAAGHSPRSLAVGDFNGDGRLDIAVVNGGDDDVGVLLNNGDGGFAAQVTFAVGSDPSSVAAGDLNGDGTPDLAVTSYDGGTVSVLLNACGP